MSEKLNAVAKAIYETVFDERWDDLVPNSIERAIYRDAARAALAKAIEFDGPVLLDALKSLARPDGFASLTAEEEKERRIAFAGVALARLVGAR